MILSYSILFSFSLFSTNAHAGEVEEREKKLGIKSALIPSGSFQMGCTKVDGDCGPDEKPQHEVRLTKSFYMMTTEATQGLYKTIMNTNPSEFSSCGDTCPVENVSWYDAVRFSNALNAYLGLESCYEIGSGDKPSVSWSNKECSGWRLPTEAEWEYAARGGEGYTYAGSNNMDDVGWYGSKSSKTHPVGQKKANGFGLYDMSGNVWEWVWDSGYRKYGSSVIDPLYVDTSSPLRVFRGGSWDYGAGLSRVSSRDWNLASARNYYRGFRFLRTIP
jgi:formylglycine-generating enzyme required for sulfatase activity